MSSLKYWLWLATRRGVGVQGMHAVLDHFGTPERAFFADPEEYDLLSSGLGRALKDRSMTQVDQVLADCDRLGVRIMTIQDADYPERLRQLDDAPCVLYLKGRWPDFDGEVAVGVVGTRKATEYGKTVAKRLGLELTRGGGLVVSGIASGIDTCAVRGALQGGGPVVCVVGGGVDVPYPWENRFLYEDVAAAGLLISEYPPGTENRGSHFPARNRIISGLSLGVVVVEADEHGSGAMITANCALDQNRDVFAVPGNVDAPASRGCIRLIQQGAKPVLSAEDILVEYRNLYPAKLPRTNRLNEAELQSRLKAIPDPVEPEPRQKAPVDRENNNDYSLIKRNPDSFTDDELAILHIMQGGVCQTDELVERTQIPARRVLSALTMLQIAGCVEERPGKRFACCVELCTE